MSHLELDVFTFQVNIAFQEGVVLSLELCELLWCKQKQRQFQRLQYMVTGVFGVTTVILSEEGIMIYSEQEIVHVTYQGEK